MGELCKITELLYISKLAVHMHDICRYISNCNTSHIKISYSCAAKQYVDLYYVFTVFGNPLDIIFSRFCKKSGSNSPDKDMHVSE